MARSSDKNVDSAGAVESTSEPIVIAHVAPLWPPWGSFAIASLLLTMASVSILVRQAETMAGAIIGYVAAYWLPPERKP